MSRKCFLVLWLVGFGFRGGVCVWFCLVGFLERDGGGGGFVCCFVVGFFFPLLKKRVCIYLRCL